MVASGSVLMANSGMGAVCAGRDQNNKDNLSEKTQIAESYRYDENSWEDVMQKISQMVGVSLFAVAYTSSANAQVSAEPPAQPQAANRDVGIADIVVTAQRREQASQDVPIAVAAFSADQLEKAGLRTATDLERVVPGVTLDSNGARSPIFLRGIGNNNYGSQSSVLTFVDGVYQPFDNTGGTEFSNVESIELAKGPQGTLFGRNATGGVLQIRTKNPLNWQGLDVQLGYANYDTLSGKIYAAAKLSEVIAADVAGFYYNQDNGWGTNLFDGSDYYTMKRYGARSKLVAELDDSFTVTLVGDYSNRRGQLGVGLSRAANSEFIFDSGADFGMGRKLFLPTIYDVNTDDPRSGWKTEEGGGALTLEKRIGEVKLLSISSYRRAKEFFLVDIDGGPVPAFTLDRTDRRRVFTQEFQASGAGDRFSWAAGLYYYYAKSKIVGPVFGGPVTQFAFFTPPGVDFVVSSTDMANSYAAYAQGTFEVFPETNVTLGARYTIEKREITGRTTGSPVLSPGSAGTQEETFKKPNFRVAIDHKFTPDILAYASWSRGFNAGFFSQQAFFFNDVLNPVIEPEEVDAYEVGIKSDLLDRHLRVNLAAFLYDYTNLQQQVYINNAVTTINAAAARVKGAEIDIVAQPVRDLTFSFSGTYLDTEYKSYPAAAFYEVQPDGRLTAEARDAAGKQLVLAPEFSWQASATYTLRTGIGTFDTTGNLNYRSKLFADPHNDFVIPDRVLIGLNERWTSNDGKTSITLWVDNLTGEQWNSSTALLTPNGNIGRPAPPRTYGVTFGRTF